MQMAPRASAFPGRFPFLHGYRARFAFRILHIIISRLCCWTSVTWPSALRTLLLHTPCHFEVFHSKKVRKTLFSSFSWSSTSSCRRGGVVFYWQMVQHELYRAERALMKSKYSNIFTKFIYKKSEIKCSVFWSVGKIQLMDKCTAGTIATMKIFLYIFYAPQMSLKISKAFVSVYFKNANVLTFALWTYSYCHVSLNSSAFISQTCIAWREFAGRVN